jgi:hypothetical protein
VRVRHHAFVEVVSLHHGSRQNEFCSNRVSLEDVDDIEQHLRRRRSVRAERRSGRDEHVCSWTDLPRVSAEGEGSYHSSMRPEPAKLTHVQELFALAYLANGYNATAAYRAVHPKCSQRTAEVNGSRLLRKAEVHAFIEREQKHASSGSE